MALKIFRKKPGAKAESQDDIHFVHEGGSLHKVLTVRDLTFFGIAAIIGAGSFSSMGTACFSGGPGVIYLFIICGIACGFTALCYAEFAARVPVSGSAYTYAYVSFGEMFAWIIGWALLMEYSIGNIYVAFSWSGYFTSLLDSIVVGGNKILHIPEYLTTNYLAAKQMHTDTLAFADHCREYCASKMTLLQSGVFKKFLESEEFQIGLKKGKTFTILCQEHYHEMVKSEGFLAWIYSGKVGGLNIIFDLPAVIINALITLLVLVGVKESRNLSNMMVIVKLCILFLVIVVGACYIDLDNWKPFMPNGFTGVMGAVSGVFFAYIGFDAVSTLAEESKNPQRDLPRGMIYSLVICTALYIILALVLTGMVAYSQLNVSDPLAEVFKLREIKWMLLIVSIAAVVAMTSVLLVFQMGQPRIWMSMSRDGLLPKKFASIHPKYKTPGFSTIVTGLVVGIPLFFTNEKFVLDFTSIGTLFAFVLVCGGVLTLPRVKEKIPGKFQLPYINGKFIVPLIFLISVTLLFIYNKEFLTGTFNITKETASKNIPMLIFFLVFIIMSVLSFINEFSLIPVLGLLSCTYLLTGMELSNWIWFSVWLLIGLVVYFSYGYRKSKLNIKDT